MVLLMQMPFEKHVLLKILLQYESIMAAFIIEGLS